MATAIDLYNQGQYEEIWKKYCGFIDLDLDQFMRIQTRLLQEQLELLGDSRIGMELFDGRAPLSVEEFRDSVPLTTYADYAPYFDNQKEGMLPVAPRWWLHTSGRSGEYAHKWVPYTPQMAQRLGEVVTALFIFASCSGRGDFPFEPGDRMLYTMAPFPYMSGGVARAVLEEFPFTMLPPLEQAEEMGFGERIELGLQMALRDGMEAFNAIAVILVRIGERFSSGAGSGKVSSAMLHPKVIARLLRGWVRSRLDGRRVLLPKDLWTVKGIATGGTDTQVFKDKVKEMWGKEPIEAYGCTEAGVFALQNWKGGAMTLLPDVDFLEFIPTDERERNEADPTYQPQTLLLDEVEAGGIYEAVITNFYGGAYTRYRTGDLLEVTALQDVETGIGLPQFVFYSKSKDIIDLGSLCRLTERTIWRAIEAAGISYADWIALKMHSENAPLLQLHIEFSDGDGDPAGARRRIHESLCELDRSYAETEELLGMRPLRVDALPPGTFKHYTAVQQERGADLAHLKPPHMNPSEEQLKLLLA